MPLARLARIDAFLALACGVVVSPAAAPRPEVQIVVLPGIGHYPHLEVPDMYVKIVKSFLAGSTHVSPPDR